MNVRGLGFGLLVLSLCGAASLVACGEDQDTNVDLDGGSSGSQSTSSGAQAASSGGGGSSGQGASSSSSSGALASSSSGSSSGGQSSSGGDLDGGDLDGGDQDDDASSGGPSDGGADGGEGDAGVDAGPPSNDPFEPSSCAGEAWPAGEALAFLNAAPYKKLGQATVMSRKRVCPGGDVNACGAWGEYEIHVQSLLTYSGGVTTDYKQFSFPTALFLYAEAGVAKYSIRHTNDVDHDANDVDHGIVFSSAVAPMTNTRPHIYVWDPAPAPNRYQDLEARLGDRATLFVGPHCARYVAPRSYSEELAALYRF